MNRAKVKPTHVIVIGGIVLVILYAISNISDTARCNGKPHSHDLGIELCAYLPMNGRPVQLLDVSKGDRGKAYCSGEAGANAWKRTRDGMRKGTFNTEGCWGLWSEGELTPEYYAPSEGLTPKLIAADPESYVRPNLPVLALLCNIFPDSAIHKEQVLTKSGVVTNPMPLEDWAQLDWNYPKKAWDRYWGDDGGLWQSGTDGTWYCWVNRSLKESAAEDYYGSYKLTFIKFD